MLAAQDLEKIAGRTLCIGRSEPQRGLRRHGSVQARRGRYDRSRL
jgi:hypothetical protein